MELQELRGGQWRQHCSWAWAPLEGGGWARPCWACWEGDASGSEEPVPSPLILAMDHRAPNSISLSLSLSVLWPPGFYFLEAHGLCALEQSQAPGMHQGRA